jgi:hypothetical protein
MGRLRKPRQGARVNTCRGVWRTAMHGVHGQIRDAGKQRYLGLDSWSAACLVRTQPPLPECSILVKGRACTTIGSKASQLHCVHTALKGRARLVRHAATRQHAQRAIWPPVHVQMCHPGSFARWRPTRVTCPPARTTPPVPSRNDSTPASIQLSCGREDRLPVWVSYDLCVSAKLNG